MHDIEGKAAVVTGGANGIGLAMGRHFAEPGMQVMLADIQPAPLARGGRDPARRRPRSVRLRRPTSRSPSRSSTSPTQRYGPTARCTCCATTRGSAPAVRPCCGSTKPNDWRWCIDVNVLGVAWGIKAFVPIMLAQGTEGHIVNTSSGNGGIAPMGDAPVYAMTKSAVTTLTELLYYQLRTQGTQLSCSVLYPGPNWLRTKLWEAWKTRPSEYAKSVAAHDAVPDASRSSRRRWRPRGHRCRSRRSRRSRRGCSTRCAPISSGSIPEVTTRSTRGTQSMKARRNPDYFRNWNPTTGE